MNLLENENLILKQKIKEKNKYIKKLTRDLKKIKIENTILVSLPENDNQLSIFDFL